MPRKTIASLEEKIAYLNGLIDERDREITTLRGHNDAAIETLTELRRTRDMDPNIYLSYTPTGHPEVDAMLVAYRALESLPDEAWARCITWVHDRLMADRES